MERLSEKEEAIWNVTAQELLPSYLMRKAQGRSLDPYKESWRTALDFVKARKSLIEDEKIQLIPNIKVK